MDYLIALKTFANIPTESARQNRCITQHEAVTRRNLPAEAMNRLLPQSNPAINGKILQNFIAIFVLIILLD
jgi:hypothetical protein